MPHRSRRIVAAISVAFAAMAGTTVPASAADVPVGTFADGVVGAIVAPRVVPGANDWACRPTAEHPRPVVLLHGTVEAAALNWGAISPVLHNAGYCVFAPTYGENFLALDGRLPALDDMERSAAELPGYIDRVLAATGATQVDIVGHSQGGTLPHYYIKRLGGAPKVANFVGLAPTNHGSTYSGLTELAEALGVLGLANTVLEPFLTSMVQWEHGSPFQQELFGDGDTVPGPNYTVIVTTHDLIVTPYATGFLDGPNVENIVIQDQCPDDPTGHLGMPYDSPTIQNVLNELGPNVPDFHATCEGYGLGL